MDNKQIIPTALGMSYEGIENLNDVRPYDFETDCGAYGLRTELVEDFFWLRIFYNEVDLGDITVIGNIHDNKELLKKEE